METIAHCLMSYLSPTKGYIYDQLLALGSERSVVFAAHEQQPERFPIDRFYSLVPQEPSPSLPRGAWLLRVPFDQLWRPVVEREQVAALHAHGARIARHFLPLARHYRIPIVTSFLGTDASANLDVPEYLSTLQWLFHSGDLFAVTCEEMARQIRTLGCPGRKVRVIRPGIPLERYPLTPRLPGKNNPCVILFVGWLVPKKGLDDLVCAFALLSRRGKKARLRIVGGGPLRAAVERSLADAGVRDCAEFLGVLPPCGIAAEMSRADLFCLPSRTGPDGDAEGIPIALLEAMASGMPVVTTRHSGIPEAVDDQVSGYLVPERDPEALADQLAHLLDNPDQWESLGRAGRAKVEREFRLSAVVSDLEANVYGPMLHSGATREY